MRTMYRAGRIAIAFLLLAGCSTHNPSIVSERVQLKQGQVVQSFRLIRINSDGKAEFHNIDAGDDSDLLPHFNVGVGQSFALETQARHRTLYNFTLEQTDPAKQEATILVRTTEH